MSVLRLYEALLTLRRTAAAFNDRDGAVRVEVLDDDTLALRRDTADQQHAVLAIVRLRGAGVITLTRGTGEIVSLDDRFALALSTESPAFAPDSTALDLTLASDVVIIRFERPGAVILDY